MGFSPEGLRKPEAPVDPKILDRVAYYEQELNASPDYITDHFQGVLNDFDRWSRGDNADMPARYKDWEKNHFDTLLIKLKELGQKSKATNKPKEAIKPRAVEHKAVAPEQPLTVENLTRQLEKRYLWVKEVKIAQVQQYGTKEIETQVQFHTTTGFKWHRIRENGVIDF